MPASNRLTGPEWPEGSLVRNLGSSKALIGAWRQEYNAESPSTISREEDAELTTLP
jgi:hypothetical protein